jgi:mannan endo-1,4-beta-mannosidase
VSAVPRRLLLLVCVGVSLAVLAAVTAASARRSVLRDDASEFVTRSGPRLFLAGRPFRFGGANIEWLGLAGYGPFDPAGPSRASHYEIDDALDTAKEMGVRVVRSQTMGDSVGCGLCLEPALGQFNEGAFEEIDYALTAARDRGIKIIPTIIGDDARAGGSGCVYLRWRAIAVPGCSIINMAPFWTDPTVLGDVEEHLKALLEHVNVYTHVAYKDDPTIFGWDLLNGGGSPTPWTRAVVQSIRGIDSRHLVLSGPANAGVQGVDVCVAFVYPHWFLPLDTIRQGIADCKAAGKPFVVYEYGWDRTNFPTQRELRAFLRSLENDPAIAGDAFWALQAHADRHGWMPIPADSSDPTTARYLESGQWWALYYTGIQTLVNTAPDMAARAQILRRHNYAMAGLRTPKHALPPAPAITSASYGPTSFVGRVGTRIYWRGSAGAKGYSVQRAAGAGGPWTTLCNRCVTDLDDGYIDLTAEAKDSWYRVVPYNLDDKPGPGSRPVSPL